MMKNYLKIYNIIIALAIICTPIANAAKDFKKYFIYLKSNEINLRSGPSKKHPIKLVIRQTGEPLIVIAKFEQWIKTCDIDGDKGWILEAFTTQKLQKAIITGNNFVALHKQPTTSSHKIARLQKNLRVKVKKCDENQWCDISINGLKGWISKKYLWGL